MNHLKSNIEVLSQSEIEKIHKSTLRILANVGIKVPDPTCLELCEKAGALIDKTTLVMKIPEKLMEDILARVKPMAQAEIGQNQSRRLVGGISTQVFIVDYKTKKRRYGVLDDVMKGIALIQHLNNIPHCDAVTIPSDIPYNMTDVVSHQKIYSYSKKYGGTYILSPTSAKYIIQMAKAIGKGTGYLLETVSPLQFRKESLEMALIFAREGQLLFSGPMVIAGATGPVTLAGTLTLQNAELLASVFIIYVLTGRAAYYNGSAHSMDLKTTLCSFGSPNQALFGIAAAQIGRFYGLVPTSNSALTDALMPDFQGGFEKASSAIISWLSGCMGIGAQGLVGADQGISYEQIVIDNEWLDAFNHIQDGFEADEETIAADLIETIGIGGNFISEEHTALHMKRSYWVSKIFNRDNWTAFESANSPSLLDKAHSFVETVTAGYEDMDPVIEASKLNEIDYIVKCAGEELARERG